MNELEERSVRFDLFKKYFRYAFNRLDESFKSNSNTQFVFDKDWNIIVRLNGEQAFYSVKNQVWIKIP